MKFKAQVCIVGSGIAGAIVAYELLQAGVSDVTIVEAGKAYEMGSIKEWDRLLSADVSPFADGYDQEVEYVNTGEYGYKLKGGRLWAKGGTTLIWTGHAFRFKPEDFNLYTNTGQGVDWPISYTDLEPFYSKAESTLGVAGQAGDRGHPPRNTPFPFPAFKYTTEDKDYLDAFDRLSMSFQHNCISRNSFSPERLVRTPQCDLIDSYEHGSGQTPFTGDQLVDYLEASGVTLLTSTSALEFNFGTKSRATSLKILDHESGAATKIEADLFVVCGGGIESPKLLLNSTNTYWEKGVGNDHELVGKFFTEHAAITVTGTHKRKEKNRRDIGNILTFNTACSRHYDTPKHQTAGKFLIEVADVRAHDLPLRSKLSDASQARYVQDENVSPFALCALVEAVPQRDNRIELGKGHNRFGTPKTVIDFSISDRTQKSVARAHKVLTDILEEMGCHYITRDPKIWWPRHHIGTCRMSNNPQGGVVDDDLRIHGTENIFVCSSAVFPTGGAANPTLTIAALAHRLGRHLVASICS